MSKTKYLIAIDSDGTLRHTDGSISNKTKETIKKVITNGSIVVVCTARPRYHTLKIANEIVSNTYLISSNGTEVYDNVHNKVIYSAYLSSDIVNTIYLDTKENNIRTIFVCDDTEYVTQFTRNTSQVLLTDSNIKEILRKQIKQIMIIGNNKEWIKNYQKILKKKYNLNVVDSSNDKKEEIWFSVISSEASKGIALKKLSEYLKIPLENTIAIGNDLNDMSMFNTAGLSVAVSNATSDLKKIANQITLSNDDDGVASFLETLLK